MSSNELISIVMTVKNALPYLEECLDSIVAQTHSNWQLLAVNDHSEDSSYDILSSYAIHDRRIRVFQNEEKGIIPGLKTAYKNAQGEYITRMDADDLMPAHKLDVMLNELKKHDEMSLVTGYVKYFSATGVQDGFQKYQGWLNSLVDNNSHRQEIYKECVIPSPCWLTTKKAFEKAGGFSSDIYPEDYDLAFRFHLSGIRIKPIQQLLHLWRDHSKRTSRTHEHYAVNSFLILKVDYFVKLDYNKNKQLVIWGAGRKGKKVAELLTAKSIQFDWICNNPNKVGVEYKGTVWKDCNKYFENAKNYQVIGLVSRPSDQQLIKSHIAGMDNVEDFWFC